MNIVLQNKKFEYDVIIVGAGPAGLGIGIVLEQLGVNYIILEKDYINDTYSNVDNIYSNIENIKYNCSKLIDETILDLFILNEIKFRILIHYLVMVPNHHPNLNQHS